MSGGILRFPWTTQPQSPVGIDPYWLARGLVFLSLGNGRFWTKNKGWGGAVTLVASPARAAGQYGLGTAFSGSNRMDAPAITTSKGFRSIVASYKPTTAGGGNLGRVFQDLGGTIANEAVFINTSAICYYVAHGSGADGQWTAGTAFTAGSWQTFGLTHDQTATGNTPSFYIDGASSGVTVNSATTGTYAATSYTPTIGNRSSDNARGFNGDIGPIAIFDHPVSGLTAAEHKTLYANIWQLLAPVERKIWVPNAGGGGPTYTLTADSGSFALTGQATGLAFNRVLAADTQSFALTGQATGIAFTRTLAAASGSFALTGQDAGLAFNRVLSAASGSYALDGQDVTLTYTPISGATYTLTAASGSFALAGQDTGLAFNRVLTADTQSYSLSGDVAGLAFNRVLTADTVSYALTGQDAALTYTGNTYTLNAESGTFFVDGQDANLVYSGGSSADTGDGSMSRKRYYLRRKGKILLFDTVAQADDYLEAEEEAQKAIAAAKSRGAKKRIAAKILKAVEPVESVEIAPLQELVKAYSMPVNLPKLLTQQDYQQVMDVRAMIQRIQDDEDDELLLLLA